MINTREKKLFCFLIIALLLFHVINNIIILTLYPYYPWVRFGGYFRCEIEKLGMRYRIVQIINTKEKLFDKFIRTSDLIKSSPQTPQRSNVTPFITAIGDLIFGEQYSVIIIHALYYLLLILGTYLVSKRFYGVAIGAFSAFLVSFYPEIFHFSRSYQLDFSLPAFYIFIFYLLLYTNNFKSTICSIIFAIFLGIGILIRGSILIFLLAPILFCLYYVFKDFYTSSRKAYRPILNLIFIILIAIIISSLWWKGNLSVVFSRFPLYLKNKVRVLLDTPFILPTEPHAFFDRIFFNINLLFKEIIIGPSEVLFLIFIFALFLFLKKKPRNNILIFSLITPLIIFYFSKLKLSRYLLSILPLMAIITSAGLFEISNIMKRKIIISLVCIIAFIQFFEKSYLNSEYKFGKFYNDIYTRYGNIAERFTNIISKQDIDLPHVVFVSETSGKNNNLNLMLKYSILKKALQKYIVLNFENNIDKADFVILLFDRKYFLRIASILEEGRKTLDTKPYRDLCKKYLVEDISFYNNLLDPKKFNTYIYNIKQLISKEKDMRPLEIYEKLIILEAIKRKALDIEEAKKQCKWIPKDISLWSNIYNQRGIKGLIQDFTLSYEEFKSWLEAGILNKPLLRDERWKWLYKKLNDYKFIIIEHDNIPSLGIDFYLFLRTKY